LKATYSGKIVGSGDTFEKAEKSLAATIADRTTVFFHWPSVTCKTKRLIPEPPNGYQLIILLFESNNNDDDMLEHFLAVPPGMKFSIGKSSMRMVTDFLIVPCSTRVYFPEGTYGHDNDCWTILNPDLLIK
jgi:hypothetical protein